MENTAEREGENTVKKLSKHICVGILAHVDADRGAQLEGGRENGGYIGRF